MNRALNCLCLFLWLALPAAHAGGAPIDKDLQRLTGELHQIDVDPALGPFGAADRIRAHQALDELAQTPPYVKQRAIVLHMAESRIAAARFAAQADLADRQIERLNHEHDSILLEATRRDADRAHAEIERLRMQNNAREEQDARAQADRELQAQQAAGIAADESAQAQALAEARAKDAALARQESALQTGAKPAAADAAATAANDPRGPSMVLPSAVFATGKPALRKDSASTALLQSLVAFVLAYPDARVRIEGHTDNRGDPQRNLGLSRLRAEAVLRHLRAAGIPASRMQAVGLGAEQPVASNATAPGRLRNQRVVVVLLTARN